MTAIDVLAELQNAGIRVEPRPNGGLYLTPKDRLTPELLAAARAHKPELLALLADKEATRPIGDRSPLPLKRCGALICHSCHALSPSPHRAGCSLPHFTPCGSRWFWMSPHRAIKCCACASPADLSLVEAWVLARETGEGDDGWRIPGQILSLLHVAGNA